ncbi:MAG: DNA translocase FtsK 4TM domain-containing protein [Patescibacteria group bacterium]
MKSDKKQKNEEKTPRLALETKSSIIAIAFFAFAFFTVLAYIKKGGWVGGLLADVLTTLFGQGYLFVSLALFILGGVFLAPRRHPRHRYTMPLIGSGLMVIAALALAELLFGADTGGLIGRVTTRPLFTLFDYWATLLLLIASVMIGILITFNISLLREKNPPGGGEEKPTTAPLSAAEISDDTPMLAGIKEALMGLRESLEKNPPAGGGETLPKEEGPHENAPRDVTDLLAPRLGGEVLKAMPAYVPPSLDLLEDDRGKPMSGDVKLNATLIQRTLQNFGIPVEMGEIAIGPSVTQYTLKPAQGVKLSRITALRNDLALALAAHPLRVEAPIPGKPFVGIEVPNRAIATVGLRKLLEHDTYQKGGALAFSLGKDVAGRPVFTDLARMPHLLIAGSTGSGKSVAIHGFLMNMLFKNSPAMLRLLLIDPKRVELSVYHGITHLLAPVIVDPKRAIMSLRWAVKEMERRYERLSETHSRDIIAYNTALAKQKHPSEALMPYIIIVIDELADLMASYGREIEASIVRISQMARAVGIHLVVSTQRPSVDVITGLIKANITARMAFQVASHTNSQIILDTTGAEALLGNGDMLFLAGDGSKPRRIQGAFVSEAEVKRVTQVIRRQQMPHYDEAFDDQRLPEEMFDHALAENTSGDEEDDALYDEAQQMVIQVGRASTSYLQRRLRVGYARAARLMDLLEQRGIIGPADGARPREVLVKEQSDALYSS